MNSPRFQLNKEQTMEILKVATWSIASVVIATLLSVWQNITVSDEYIWLIPLVNTVLYALKKWVSNKQGKVI